MPVARPTPVGFGPVCAWLLLLLSSLWAVVPASAAEIDLPARNTADPIDVQATDGTHWPEGAFEVYLLSGVNISQGDTQLTADEAVLWVRSEGEFPDRTTFVTLYAGGKVTLLERKAKLTDKTYLGEFETVAGIQLPAVYDARQFKSRVLEDEPLYQRAMRQRQHAAKLPEIQQVQFQEEIPAEEIPARLAPNQLAPNQGQPPSMRLPPEAIPATPLSALPPPAGQPAPVGRRLRAFPRSSVPFQLESRPSGRGTEQVTIITQGVNLLIDGLATPGAAGSSVDLAADRMVIWTVGGLDLSGRARTTEQQPVEIYLEGNIVFREGERVIYATRMFYDAANNIGVVLDAEMVTSVPQFQGLIRVRADEMRQVAKDRFEARDAWVTTSLLGRPTYRWQSGSLSLEDRQYPVSDPATGMPITNPQTGQQVMGHSQPAQAYHNTLRFGDIPVFYWPYVSADLADLDIVIRKVAFRNDQIFGTQILTEFDMFGLLGIRQPANTDWSLQVDYLSERGLGYGTNFLYSGDDLLGLPGPYFGMFDAWAIQDSGLDQLGSDRRNFFPEKDYRYRLLGRHRHRFDNNWIFTGELGLISDRNFLEQYYPIEWDTFKDETTGVELKHLNDNRSLSIVADYRVNDFFTQTNWLPKADHVWLGQSLLGNRLTWSEHTSAGYGHLKIVSTPLNPEDAAKSTPLPWEVDSRGERFVTTHELAAPLTAGPFKVVPYGLGQFAHWGEDLSGNDLQRFYGQSGVRASLPLWAAMPDVESSLWNVHGLAHKAVFEVDAYVAEANQDVDELPLYDNIDDDSIEHFRRRFAFNTFGGTTPQRFDERYYAIREGQASNVTSPVAEIADDMAAVRMSLQQRWQTKRGPRENQRIIDWIVLDTGITYFPDATRDNYGEELGLANYNFRWHVGDRFTIFSDGAMDFFDEGLRTVSLGAALTRSPRGVLRADFRILEGPISSQVLTVAYDYRLSPKWASTGALMVDFGNGGSTAQSFTLTRIGESFLFRVGFSYNEYLDNVGVVMALEPRFLAGALSRVGGSQVGLAGNRFLE